jgi:hypothetical protein
MKIFEIVEHEPAPIELDMDDSTNYPPDGTYDGVMGGYVVKFMYINREYILHTKMGVRGMNIPYKVKIIDKKIEVI